jgi:carboxyl-terminal processing protease
MRRGLLFVISLILMYSLAAQSIDQKASDAWLISRMVEKFHVQPRPLDKDMSAAIFDRMLDDLDGQHLIFTAADISRLSAWRLTLDDEILNKRTGFLTLLTGLYRQRLMQTDSITDIIAAKPFNFSLHESLTVAEDTSSPANQQAERIKIYKLLKYSVGHTIAGDLLQNSALTAKSKDSLEILLRKKATARLKRTIRRVLQSPMGIDNVIGAMYCEALATCYDPHTDYFPPDEKAAFESELGNKPLSFGLTLTEDENGNAVIGRLQAGGPAFQSGNLHAGDKILTVRWDDKEAIDVSGASLEETQRILADEGGTRLTMTVKKSDGTTRDVSLQKQKLATGEEDEDKVKGFILKGAQTVGYISLPAFYSDWEDSRGINGCANDVAKEILKLKKENINGLILDLRYNGGGSMQEAVELAGIFIDAGPVTQIKTRDAKVITLKDVNRGTVYDGPLLLLVNGSSASASEVLAGTLQDYHRALIVGSPTYGKATAQIVLPMDTTVDLDTYTGQAQASSYIKMTIEKLYRITGNTAQRTGVQPDVTLPDPPDALAQREADEKFALPATTIPANKYYQPLAPLPVAAVQAVARKAMDSSSFFREAGRHPLQAKKPAQDISLSLDDILAERKKTMAAEGLAAADSTDIPTPAFSISNPAYENQRLQTDPEWKKMNEERKNEVLHDPYITVAWQLIAPLMK